MADRYQRQDDDYGRGRREVFRGASGRDEADDWQAQPGGERWRGEYERGRGEYDPRQFAQGGVPQRRGVYERERYPDEGYGGRSYGRGGWEREQFGAPMTRYGWGARGMFGEEEEEGTLGYSGLRQDVGPWRGRQGWLGQQALGRFAGLGPKDYRRSDDRIREDISDRLTDDAFVDASDIVVLVESCEVTLSGTVDTRDQKRRAEDIAEGVSGVRDVNNQVRVKNRGGLLGWLTGDQTSEQQAQGESRGTAPGRSGQSSQAADRQRGTTGT